LKAQAWRSTGLPPKRKPRLGVSSLRKENRHDRRQEQSRPAGSRRINLNEDYEVRYRTRKFGVSKTELEKTVAKVGESAAAVAQAVGKTL
jgi:hypothetical protein